jgi:hypothetical protein
MTRSEANQRPKRKHNGKRPSKYGKTRPPELDKFSYELALQTIARRLELGMANRGATRLHHGALKEVVKEMRPTYTWLSVEMIRDHLRNDRIKKRELLRINTEDAVELPSSAASQQNSRTSTLSTLSRDSGYESIVRVANKSPDYLVENHIGLRGDAGYSSFTFEDSPAGDEVALVADNDQEAVAETTVTGATPPPSVVIHGRPKGSTMAQSRDLKQRIRLAIADAAKQYSDALHAHHKLRLPNGTMQQIIVAAKSKYRLADNVVIKTETIRSRHKRASLNPELEQGTPSPMAQIEPCLSAVILKLSQMRQPITPMTGLLLVNSLIEGTSVAKHLESWKLKHNIQTRLLTKTTTLPDGGDSHTEAASALVSLSASTVASSDNTTASKTSTAALGTGYWRGFMKRNRHLIRSKKGVKFEAKRAEWCTYDNFVQMYEEVYKQMVACGIASKVDRKVHVDKSGNIVEFEADSYGLPTQYLMQRPDKVLFVDEVGSNTSTTKDGNIGGEKFLCHISARPQIRAATRDSHFTVLGFTAANGEPVMCAVIFSAKSLCEEWVIGFNASAPWIGADDDVDANTGGVDKRFPMGPVCTFNGIEVPTLCCCSENGSITAHLLVQMLKTIDELNVFDRSDGIPPFLLLDGHGSRFDLEFLEYVNGVETNWRVCIGVPYGTSYWQVGDSTEQNGCFKMALTKHKRNLLNAKSLVGQDFALDKEDVIPVVHKAWNDSFARVKSNQNAIAERGWMPLTYNCLLHPEILQTRINTTPNAAIETNDNTPNDDVVHAMPTAKQIQQLNLSDGLSGIIMTSIIECTVRENARNGVNIEANRLRRLETAQVAIDSKGKRYSAGQHVAVGQHYLGPTLLKDMRARKNQKVLLECDSQEKRLQAFRAQERKVNEVKALRKPYEELKVDEVRVLVMWYRRAKQDLPVPTTKPLLLARLRETCHRGDRDPPPLPDTRPAETENAALLDVDDTAV